MDAKKDETRFTIKFNPANPRHKEAMRILNEDGGRRKASLIADALCMYVHGNSVIDVSTIKNPVQVAKVESCTPMHRHETNAPDKRQPSTDDSWATINESLDGFF